ncbi:hypothetical protein [Vibrio hippocampi]|uniref:Uncharacterized protein n=1 Tax=Vibrio hippocampi TaxID=654686 RepID=A0ABM8ZL43_9VIBR|nr:hypothetical protein [Vibrio hippocampi]CAH0528836.1 hypothetical protein VHP8226_02863 [Vibrio hippocampi]
MKETTQRTIEVPPIENSNIQVQPKILSNISNSERYSSWNKKVGDLIFNSNLSLKEIAEYHCE